MFSCILNFAMFGMKMFKFYRIIFIIDGIWLIMFNVLSVVE